MLSANEEFCGGLSKIMSRDKPPRRLLKAHVEQNGGDDASFDNNSVTLPVNWTFISHSLPHPYVVKISENTPRLLLLFVTNYWHQKAEMGAKIP